MLVLLLVLVLVLVLHMVRYVRQLHKSRKIHVAHQRLSNTSNALPHLHDLNLVGCFTSPEDAEFVCGHRNQRPPLCRAKMVSRVVSGRRFLVHLYLHTLTRSFGTVGKVSPGWGGCHRWEREARP